MAMETVNSLRQCNKRRRSLKRNQFDDVLPKEIMYDIFSRLPVQTLSQFRFVSKHWFNLINDPLFINLHHSSSSSTAAAGGGGLLIVSCISKGFDRQIYLLDNNEEDQNAIPCCFSTISSSNLKSLNIKFDGFPSPRIKLIASSNGFICVGVVPRNDIFYICNPVTRELLRLPEAPDLGPSCETNNLQYLYATSSGFVFYAPTREYKVVRTWYYCAMDSRLIYTGIEIYTVGSGGGGIWKRIDKHNIICTPTPMFKRLPRSQEFINGGLHWELQDFRIPELKHSIGVVHVGDENFTTLETPPVDNGLKFRDLMSSHQCLCLTDEFSDRLVIWVMKSYGVAASWVREHVIAKEMLGPLQTASFITVKTLKNGSVLLRGGEYHGYYHFERKEFKQILIHTPTIKLDVVDHIGSLISPTSIAGPYEEYQVPPTAI